MGSHGLLRAARLNIRSLLPKYLDLESLILNEDLDVFAVSETWLSPSILSQHISINGYRLVRKDRGSRGGGVCIYLRDCFNYHIIECGNAIEQV